MKFFRHLKLRHKLISIQFVTIMIASVIVGLGLYFFQIEQIKQKKKENTITIAKVLSFNILPAMQFMDVNVATDVLKTVKEISEIEEVYILETNNTKFASYLSDTTIEATPIFNKGESSCIFTENYLYTQFVILDGEKSLGVLMIRSNLNDLAVAKNRFLITLLLSLLSMIIISLVLITFVQKGITLSITKLLDGIENISKNQDYNLRVKKHGNDEIGQLTEKFNNLISIVEEKNNLLSSDNEKLDILVKLRTSELEVANDKLGDHLKELEATNLELSKFVYIVSHDLKAPLRAISTLSSFVEEDIGEDVDEDVKKNLDLIRQRTFRMQNLIEGLLQYSKSGKVIKNKTNFNLSEILDDLETLFESEKKHKFYYNFKDNIQIHADKLQMQQVLQNLIQNALKYNDKSIAEVIINFEESEKYYKFEIIDNGLGIKPEFHKKVFEVFNTLHGRDEIESTGIGLSIVKRVIEDNNGEISIHSNSDCGCNFTFTWKK